MLAGIGADHPVAEIFQHFRGRHRDQRIVVDKQDDRRALDLLRGRRRTFRFRRGGRDRQHQRRAGSLSDGAGQLQRAAKLDRKPMHHGQSEAGAFADRL